MPFTWVDLQIFKGKERGESSYVAFNPYGKPGRLVIAGTSAIKESIGSQLACKLGIQNFVDASLNYFGGLEGQIHRKKGAGEIGVEAIEYAFKEANIGVYNFGHKLAAGGRMAASLLALVVDNDAIAIGRVGYGSAYLFRINELFPFFEVDADGNGLKDDSFMGSSSTISVELASVHIQEFDTVLLFSRVLDVYEEEKLRDVLSDVRKDSDTLANIIKEASLGEGTLEYAMTVIMGPQTIYLR